MKKKIVNEAAAVIYARYSAGLKQTDQSIEGQIADCQEYAKQHGLTVIEHYIDRHISGKEDSNRSEFQRMLKDCCSGQFKYIITWKVDQFDRNREEIAINKSKLKRAGVQRLDLNKLNSYKYAANVPFLFSGKMICGECGSSYCGESGTSKMGLVHRYYKCHGRKTHKTVCDAPTLRKDWFEQYILSRTISDVLNDNVVDYLVKEIIRVQESDPTSSELSILHREKRNVEKSLSNILRAIESGIFNDTTAERMSQLEHRGKELSIAIAKAELQRLRLTPDHLYYWFNQFRNGDINDVTFQNHLVDAFVNKIFVYKDRVVIAYNCANNNPCSIDLSELSSCVRTRSLKVD